MQVHAVLLTYFLVNEVLFWFIIIIIMNISPRKLIQEPQMRSCSSHLSNKNVFSSQNSKMDLSS